MDGLGVNDSSLDHVHHQNIGMNQENICAPWITTQSFNLGVQLNPAQKALSAFKNSPRKTFTSSENVYL